MNKIQCPRCQSYGVALMRRSMLKKALRYNNMRRCIDCGYVFSLREVKRVAENTT